MSSLGQANNGGAANASRRRMMLLYVVLAVSAAALAFWASKESPIRKGKPHVFVLLLDTLRADHLGIYGYERDTSPNLDRFARENLWFPHVMSTASWTPSAVTSLFTGLYAASHRMMPPDEHPQARKLGSRVSKELVTMPELFRDEGYFTAAVSTNTWIHEEFGFSQGFDVFAYNYNDTANLVTDWAVRSVLEAKESNRDKPMFLYLHYIDPHDDYEPPGEYATMFTGELASRSYGSYMQNLINLYDGEIRFLDHHVGRFLSFLKEQGLYEDSLIIIIGDHGEQFGERGSNGHGYQLFNEEIHVPLFVRLPGGIRHGRVDHLVSTIDILPTVAELTTIELPKVQGISIFDDEALAERRGVLSEIRRKVAQRAYINREGKKLIIGGSHPGDFGDVDDPEKDVVGVFDSFAETIESTRIEDAGLLRELQSELSATLADALRQRIEDAAGEPPISQLTIDQLKTLGYLQ